MISALPMYDWPELADAHAALWTRLSDEMIARGLDCPKSLVSVDDNVPHWLSDQLYFSQTCGYPFATKLLGQVKLVATPRYDVEGCKGSTYSSAIVVSDQSEVFDLSDSGQMSFAYNSADSLSGYRCMKPLVGNPETAFRSTVKSGAHRNSALMVADGAADCAAIDAVCWHLFQRYQPDAAKRLRVLTWGPVFPALPFITSTDRSESDVATMRGGLVDVLEQQPLSVAPLRLSGVDILTDRDYGPLADL